MHSLILIHESRRIPSKCFNYHLFYNKHISLRLSVSCKNLFIFTGCRFHLTQSWWRNIQNLGLAKEYKDKDSECGRWLRWVFGLSLLRPDEVEDCFVEDLMSIMPTSAQGFADYLVETYITEDSLFPPHLWASGEVSSDRTTNACEAFHSKFAQNFNSSHPNIFAFVEVLVGIQIDVYIGLRSLAKSRISTDKKYLKSIENITVARNKLEMKEISRLDYVKRASFHYKK